MLFANRTRCIRHGFRENRAIYRTGGKLICIIEFESVNILARTGLPSGSIFTRLVWFEPCLFPDPLKEGWMMAAPAHKSLNPPGWGSGCILYHFSWPIETNDAPYGLPQLHLLSPSAWNLCLHSLDSTGNGELWRVDKSARAEKINIQDELLHNWMMLEKKKTGKSLDEMSFTNWRVLSDVALPTPFQRVVFPANVSVSQPDAGNLLIWL